MVRSELMKLATALSVLNEKEMNIKTSYAIAKNIKAIAGEVTLLEEMRKNFSEGYEGERRALCEEYAERDVDGNVKIENNNYVLLADTKEDFYKKMDELSDKYRPKSQEFADLMDGEVDVNLTKIKIDDLPSMKPSELTALFSIIEE